MPPRQKRAVTPPRAKTPPKPKPRAKPKPVAKPKSPPRVMAAAAAPPLPPPRASRRFGPTAGFAGGLGLAGAALATLLGTEKGREFAKRQLGAAPPRPPPPEEPPHAYEGAMAEAQTALERAQAEGKDIGQLVFATRGAVQAASAQYAALQQQLAAALQQTEEAKRRLAAFTQEREDVEMTVVEEKKRVVAARQLIQALPIETKALEAKVAEQEQKLGFARQQFQQLTGAVQRIEEEKKEAQAIAVTAASQLRALQLQKQAEDGKLVALQKDLENERKQFSETEAQLGQLRSGAEKYIRERQEEMKQLEEAKRKADVDLGEVRARAQALASLLQTERQKYIEVDAQLQQLRLEATRYITQEQKDKKDLEERKRVWQESFAKASEELKQRSQELDGARNAALQVFQQFTEEKRKTTEAEASLAQLRRNAEAYIKQQQVEKADLEQRKEVWRNSYATASAELQLVSARSQALETALQASRARFVAAEAKAKEELAEQTQRAEVWKATNARTVTQLEETKRSLEQQTTQLEDAVDQLGRKKLELEGAQEAALSAGRQLEDAVRAQQQRNLQLQQEQKQALEEAQEEVGEAQRAGFLERGAAEAELKEVRQQLAIARQLQMPPGRRRRTQIKPRDSAPAPALLQAMSLPALAGGLLRNAPPLTASISPTGSESSVYRPPSAERSPMEGEEEASPRSHTPLEMEQ